MLSLAAGVVGYFFYQMTGGDEVETRAVLHRIERGDFELSVIERGEIKSAGVTEIRSEVKTKNQPGLAILRVVPEGSTVKAGDFLVELDSSALEDERLLQQNIVNLADATVVEMRNLYETALIAKQEYAEGTYVQERQILESELFVAEENLNRAKEYYQYSQKLAAKGHVNELQLEADKFAVEKSAKELDAARTKLRVLDEFTKLKMIKQLESDIVITEAKWGSAKKNYELELAKLEEIESQIAKCTIHAPKDGVVLYANERGWRGDNDFVVEEGAMIRERQVIITLPESDVMQVELKINEALVQFVKPGMPAIVSPIGVEGIALQGEVTSVNRYAEPSGWRNADVKEYKAFVTIKGIAPGLRSGMTASVNVKCDYVPDALQVPVQAVHAHGEEFYCLVRRDGDWEPRRIECGATNSEFFVVNDGLQEGERVAMNPRRYVDQVTLPQLPPASPRQPGLEPLPEKAVAATDTAEPEEGTHPTSASADGDRSDS